jgi:putative redox protein
MIQATSTLGNTDFEMKIQIGKHTLIGDEPASNGGQDKGPAPKEYLCVALASCTTATLKMYMNHKKMVPTAMKVEVELLITEDKKNIFKRKLHIEGPFDETQRERFVQIANACPVHKILAQANTVETILE